MVHRRHLVAALAAAALLATLVAGSPAESAPAAAGRPQAAMAPVDDGIRLNEMQVIGSHNSYKRMVSPSEEALRRSFLGDGANLMQYQHEPLGTQFGTQKVRQIELDVFLDSAGGLYKNPLLRSVAGVGPYDAAMDVPGIKVLHVQDVDYNSTCLSFVACLQAVEAWSDANPNHLPIAILVELKDEPLSFGDFTFTTPELWNAAGMDALDAEIRSVMDPGDMITPDDVRGGLPTLNQAVTSAGWPTVDASRGKVMFMMDNGGGYRTDYLTGHPSLQGRVLFTNANPGDADAAFIKRNDPFDASIPGLVEAGYVVRTRADGDTVEARANNTAPRDAALASGAQWVSTDYPVPGMAVGFTSPYYAEIPGGTVARCNPVSAREGCTALAIEDLSLPKVVPGAASVVEGDSGTKTLEIPVTLSKPSTQTVTAKWNTTAFSPPPAGHATPATDYVAASGTVTFAPGDTTKSVTVTIKGDTKLEPDELVLASFNTPTNATIGGFYGLGLGTILDDDAKIVVVPGTSTTAEGNAGTTTMLVPVSLDQASRKSVTVSWATGFVPGAPDVQATPGDDYQPSSGTVTFAPGETTKYVTVPVITDNGAEADEYVVVFFNEPVNARMGGYWGLGFGVITNDDAPVPE